MEVNFPDFSKQPWQLTVVLAGALFSIFSLIYDDKYIYYGLVTFVYGIVAQFCGAGYDYFISKSSTSKPALFFIPQVVLIFAWIVILLRIYW